MMSAHDRVYVWDLAVRVFHWSLVVLFFVAYFTGESEGGVHSYAGYGVAALVVFRVIWGVVGSRHARFGSFMTSPVETLAYLRSLLSGTPTHYDGHNPAGGWMVVALLVALAGVSWSGLALYGAEGHGPLAGGGVELLSTAYADDDGYGVDHDDDHDDDDRGDERGGGALGEAFWEEVHELFVNLTLVLVGVHVVGVLISSLAHGENLIGAMISGYKQRPRDTRSGEAVQR